MFCTSYPLFEQCLPIRLDLPGAFGSKVMVLAAHPDDETMGMGGTILRAVASGISVRVVYVTDGGAGGPGDYAQNVRLRRMEAEALASRTGYSVAFLDASDGEFELSPALVDGLRRCYQEYRPDSICLPWVSEAHPAHRQVNHLLLETLRGDIRQVPVYAYSIWSNVPANTFVDISGVFEEKLQSVANWESQLTIFDYVHYIRGMNAYYSYLQSGKGFVEPFFNLPLSEYLDMLSTYYR
jgi:LmbE family N-acetylglucosaminyl deacetylase